MFQQQTFFPLFLLMHQATFPLQASIPIYWDSLFPHIRRLRNYLLHFLLAFDYVKSFKVRFGNLLLDRGCNSWVTENWEDRWLPFTLARDDLLLFARKWYKLNCGVGPYRFFKCKYLRNCVNKWLYFILSASRGFSRNPKPTWFLME